jgi:hypothetical protein
VHGYLTASGEKIGLRIICKIEMEMISIREKAFDASIRWLNFSLNDIGKMEDRAISAGFLRGDISRYNS